MQGEVEVLREEKKMLTGQARKLNNELRASLRRREATSAQQVELNEVINELELECRAAEGDVRYENEYQRLPIVLPSCNAAPRGSRTASCA